MTAARRLRLATACLLGFAVVAAGPPAGAATAMKKPPRSACQQLAKRYKDVAGAATRHGRAR